MVSLLFYDLTNYYLQKYMLTQLRPPKQENSHFLHYCLSPGINSTFHSQRCEDLVPHCFLKRGEKSVGQTTERINIRMKLQ